MHHGSSAKSLGENNTAHAQPSNTADGIDPKDHEAYKILAKRTSHSNVMTDIRTYSRKFSRLPTQIALFILLDPAKSPASANTAIVAAPELGLEVQRAITMFLPQIYALVSVVCSCFGLRVCRAKMHYKSFRLSSRSKASALRNTAKWKSACAQIILGSNTWISVFPATSHNCNTCPYTQIRPNTLGFTSAFQALLHDQDIRKFDKIVQNHTFASGTTHA